MEKQIYSRNMGINDGCVFPPEEGSGCPCASRTLPVLASLSQPSPCPPQPPLSLCVSLSACTYVRHIVCVFVCVCLCTDIGDAVCGFQGGAMPLRHKTL